MTNHIEFDKDHRYNIEPSRLVLAESTGPLLSLRFSESDPHPDGVQLADWCLDRRTAKFRGEGDELDFLAVGRDDVVEPDGEGNSQRRLEVHGHVVSESFASWLSERPSFAEPLLIHQRVSPDDAPRGGWEFFGRLLDSKLGPSSPTFMESVNRVFPPFSTFPRPWGLSDAEFLEGVVDHVRQRLPTLLGWYAVAGESQPIRLLVADDPSAPSLGDRWEVAPRMPAGRLGFGPERSCFGLSRWFALASSWKLIRALCMRVQADSAASLGLPADSPDVGQVVVSPGPARFRGATRFVRRVTYHFGLDPKAPSVTCELEFGPSPLRRGCADTVWLDGGFSEWAPGKGARRDLARLTPLGNGWAVAGDAGAKPDPDRTLVVRLVSPSGRSGSGRGGVYCARRAGDEHLILAIPGQVPTSPGGTQELREALEKYGIALDDDSVGLLAGGGRGRLSLDEHLAHVTSDLKVDGDLDVK